MEDGKGVGIDCEEVVSEREEREPVLAASRTRGVSRVELDRGRSARVESTDEVPRKEDADPEDRKSVV